MDLNSLEPKDLENLPKRRNPGARYLAYFESLEFPEFINKLQFLFNWTMGPTLESDLFTQPASMQQNQKVYISIFEYIILKKSGAGSFFMIKFIYSEKATKFCEIFPFLLTVCTVVKSKGKFSQNFCGLLRIYEL